MGYGNVSATTESWSRGTHNLELQRHDAEVENLHGRPDHVIRLQRRNVHFLELASNGATAAALGDGHEEEEERETCHLAAVRNVGVIHTDGGHDQLIQGDPLERLGGGGVLGERERGTEESEPAVLHGSDEEAVGNEARQPLKVKGRRQAIGEVIDRRREVLLLEVVELNGHGIGAGPAALDGRHYLGDCVGDASEDLARLGSVEQKMGHERRW
jgi:hypothetical protein